MVFGDRFSIWEENQNQFKKSVKLFSELLGSFVPSDAILGIRVVRYRSVWEENEEVCERVGCYTWRMVIRAQNENGFCTTGRSWERRSIIHGHIVISC